MNSRKTHTTKIKKTWNNPFSKASGIEAISVLSEEGCLVSRFERSAGHSIAKYAYALYKEVDPGKLQNFKIEQRCRVSNCVRQEHLRAHFAPTPATRKAIETNIWMTPEALATRYDCTVEEMQRTINQLKS